MQYFMFLFQASVIHLIDTDELDTTRLQGDGSNTVIKKGGRHRLFRAQTPERRKRVDDHR